MGRLRPADLHLNPQAISCHYANGSVCDYINIEGTSQQMIADEVRFLFAHRPTCLSSFLSTFNLSTSPTYLQVREIAEKKLKQVGHEVTADDIPSFQVRIFLYF